KQANLQGESKKKVPDGGEFRSARQIRQNGLTTTRITMRIRRTVGTSLRIRKNFADFRRRSAANSRTYLDKMPCTPIIPSTRASLMCSQWAAIQPPFQASQRPSTQVTIIAGLMIALSRRRSITLKVSDCREPGSASQ